MELDRPFSFRLSKNLKNQQIFSGLSFERGFLKQSKYTQEENGPIVIKPIKPKSAPKENASLFLNIAVKNNPGIVTQIIIGIKNILNTGNKA